MCAGYFKVMYIRLYLSLPALFISAFFLCMCLQLNAVASTALGCLTLNSLVTLNQWSNKQTTTITTITHTYSLAYSFSLSHTHTCMQCGATKQLAIAQTCNVTRLFLLLLLSLPASASCCNWQLAVRNQVESWLCNLRCKCRVFVNGPTAAISVSCPVHPVDERKKRTRPKPSRARPV